MMLKVTVWLKTLVIGALPWKEDVASPYEVLSKLSLSCCLVTFNRLGQDGAWCVNGESEDLCFYCHDCSVRNLSLYLKHKLSTTTPNLCEVFRAHPNGCCRATHSICGTT